MFLAETENGRAIDETVSCRRQFATDVGGCIRSLTPRLSSFNPHDLTDLKIDVSFHFEDEQGRRRDTAPDETDLQTRQPTRLRRRALRGPHDGARHQRARTPPAGRQGLVPLIQFGPARERGPREPVQPVELRSGGNIVRDASANEQAAARSGNIAAFRRVQIRSATMNNGQREPRVSSFMRSS